jgi:gliding motility-associated-like protein
MNNALGKCLYSFLLLLVSLVANLSTFGQDLTIHPTFNNMYGAGFVEDLYTSFETSDGGFILAGKAFQNAITGNINDPFCGVNNSDYWIVKTDIDGNTEWDTLFGGSGNESLFDMIETSDGGYALVGQTVSMASCDVPAGNLFVNDAWVVKIDTLGDILWTSRFGSTQGDNAKSIIETTDGGLLIGGDTLNLVDNAPDYWITKLDGTTGAVLWDNSIGGDNFDFLEVVRETTDGFFLGGYSVSGVSKDKSTANFGSWDYWIVKVDVNGNYVWDISYGGSGNDQLWDMEVTSDGGLIIGGFSDSNPSILPNNKTAPNIGGEDCWAIKVNSAGAIIWDQSYGGADLDRIYSVEVVDLTDCVTNYIFGGITSSGASGDVTDANIGAGDYWINFVDASGNLIWEKNYGGDQYEEIRDFRRNSDGSYIVGGYTISDNHGDVPSTNYGVFDNWAFKLSCNFSIPDLVDGEVCEGESITLTAATGTCDNCTYQWDANGGNATTNSITVSPAATETYIVIVNNATCCSDTTSATIIWYPSPTVDLGADTETCSGQSIPLDATTPTCTYAWSTGAATPIINPTMAGTYSVTITCEFGCTNTDEIIISSGIIPIVDLGNNTTLCAGDSLLLDAGTGGMNYNWSTGATAQMIYGNDETNYCVTVTSVDGCTTLDCISINFDTIQVLLPNDTTLCPADTLVLSAGNNGCTYNWSTGSTSQSTTISTTGTYTVTVTCGPTSCAAVDEIIVGYFSVNSPQNISAEICQGDSTFLGGDWQINPGSYPDTLVTINGCDSIIITDLIVNDTFEIIVDSMICNSALVGLDTIYLFSQNGCDSNVIYNLILIDLDTFTFEVFTCDSNLVDTTFANATGLNGECDSILIVNTIFACDTIYINSISCNPLDTGIFIQINGGNIMIDSISLAPTDSTYLTENSCNSLDTGLILTSSLQNIFGCDSLIFTYTDLLTSQNILTESTTCDATQAGVFIDTLQNQFGCDTIITNSISLLTSNIDTILTLTCFIDNVETDTLFAGTNSIGCDSLVLAITVYEQVIEAFISFLDISCFGESDGVILIDSVSGGAPPYMYSLDNMPFQSNPIFTNLPADNYTILIEDADGCQTLAVVPLNSINEIIVNLGDDLFVNIGDSVSIFAQINIDPNELDTIIWTTIDSINCTGNCLNFTVTPSQSTTYSIMIIYGNSCSAQDEITVNVVEDIPVYIPNAFSPNGDNQNDKITIFGNTTLIDEVQFFRIFDRWGELVYQEENFQPNNHGNGWDGNLNGKAVNPAVFIYFAEVRFIDGSIKQFKGDITLIR